VDLATAIENDPSDENFAVYADWLQEQGDVRGELAALQAKGLPDTELLQKHADYFYGALAPYIGTAVTPNWRHGWLDSLELESTRSWDVDKSIAVDDVAKLLALFPVASARFLRELVISRPIAEGEYNFGPLVTALGKALPHLPVLRRLELARFNADDSELSWSHTGKLDEIWPHLRKLESLKLRAGSMALGAIELPSLRELVIETGGFDAANLRIICATSWPNLEKLSIWFGQQDFGCTCRPEHVQPILDGTRFPKLVHLGLKNAEWGDELAPLVVSSKILPRLRTLDVSMSHLTARGLVAYEQAAEALQHLEHVDMSRCLLDDEAQESARTFLKSVKLDSQRDVDDYEYEDDPDAGYRYTAVGE